MEFNGFRSIAEYESECKRLGYVTERVPFSREGKEYFALITGLAAPSASAIKTWHLFPADESAELLDGVINGNDANYLGKLAAHGFTRRTAN